MDGKTVHFCYVDKRMYRLEADIERHKARCNFNDPKGVAILEAPVNAALSSPDLLERVYLA